MNATETLCIMYGISEFSCYLLMIRLKALSRMEISTDLNQIDTEKSTYC